MIYAILGVISVLVVVILVRTLLFKPTEENIVETEAVDLNIDKIVSNLSRMIQCKTISHNDREKMDLEEFKKFRELLKTLYPNLHRLCKREEIGDSGILYHWKGKQSDQVTILMSHYDVVPANEELWSKEPYGGIVEDETIWGRGTLDTKGTLCGALEAAEYLIEKGFVPQQDIYFSFSGDEEISGESAPAIVEYLNKKNIRPALVLDEGGAVVENIFPGVKEACALIGIGEKGYMDVELEITGQGGHSSAPPPHSLVGILAKAVVKIEKNPFNAHLTPPSLEMLNTLGRHSSFGMRIIFANLWCFGPLLGLLFKRKGGEMNALLRTTCAVTKMEGSKAFNVLPPKARVGLNLRLLATDTVEDALEYLRKVINEERIKLSVIESRNASPYANTKSPQWGKVKNAISQTWPGAIVSPYLMLAGSDARHFCKISDNVLRFSAMKLSKEDIGLIHGNDEGVRISTLMETVSFYVRLIKQC
ncbi:M20 family peptidase [Alkaliphilus peptidifermentans]|uniref:Carboxypeptidase PM20D1 n=1 Tax=Alkaliphilus peptidifermentans DSM 18978 TaxID=1120976 RepID=A0A1G5J060_9FIRM|nr:M20 family peptidase [Alkaliphilus peptidifermentans]SCY81743.1 carboxypeptidase PM20D1 [Alkaliphilus peptidifermentans DSM 18978]